MSIKFRKWKLKVRKHAKLIIKIYILSSEKIKKSTTKIV